ncbi:MAG: hypothetical protein ACK5Z5_00105 [Neisseriaceae bacterium]
MHPKDVSNKKVSYKNIKPTLLCFSHLRWNFVFQRPQHLLSRFANDYNILYVEEPIYIEGNKASLAINVVKTQNVKVLAPQIPTWFSADMDKKAQFHLIRDFLINNNIKVCILWYYTPMSIQWSKNIPAKLTIYDCMDELSAFKFAPPEIKKCEQELLSRANIVFTGGISLYKAKCSQHDYVYLFPSSVDTIHFIKARNNLSVPHDQKPIPYPRLGFYGVVDERFDIDLLAGLADKRPDWNFIILGPIVKIDPATLPQSKNIYYLGPKNYEELPYYLSSWDIALILFAINESTKYISPTKTPEYLAGGKPVVSTPIQDIVNTYKNTQLVRIANPQNLTEFETAILSALADAKTPSNIYKEADLLLKGLSWNNTYLAMREIILKAQTRKEVA